MFRKAFAQVLVLVFLLLAFFGTPLGAQAGGVCGGTYVVDAGDTADSIAARCGTSASAIYAANPGISGTLYAGQVLMLPGSSNTVPSTPIPPTPATATVNNYNTYNYYNYPAASSSSNGTYIVQPGDTFSSIASRYGLSVQQLWAANPQILNINYIYAGQVIYIPNYSGYAPLPNSHSGPSPAFVWDSPCRGGVWIGQFGQCIRRRCLCFAAGYNQGWNPCDQRISGQRIDDGQSAGCLVCLCCLGRRREIRRTVQFGPGWGPYHYVLQQKGHRWIVNQGNPISCLKHPAFEQIHSSRAGYFARTSLIYRSFPNVYARTSLDTSIHSPKHGPCWSGQIILNLPASEVGSQE